MTNGCPLPVHNSRQTDRTTSVQILQLHRFFSQSFETHTRCGLCMTFTPIEFHEFSEFSASRVVGV